MKRYLIQKAKNETKSPLGKFASLKMDGMHVVWDGGMTRDMQCKDVPFANPNHGQRIATGLWSQYAVPVSAPEWWLDRMPRVMSSGELWAPGIIRDTIMGAKRHVPSEDLWEKLKLIAFTLIPPISFFAGGKINLPHLKVDMGRSWTWFSEQPGFQVDVKPSYTFYQRLFLLRRLTEFPSFVPVDQYKIDRMDQIDELKEQLTPCHDGLVYAKETALWEPNRNDAVTKDKDALDAEGVIVDMTDGLGKYDGMVGALTVAWNGVQFNLSGMTDAERAHGYHKIGEEVTFKYRALTKDGIPVEARYWRKR